jgi:hypothetical protein
VISFSDTFSKVSRKVSISKVLSEDFSVGKMMVGLKWRFSGKV